MTESQKIAQEMRGLSAGIEALVSLWYGKGDASKQECADALEPINAALKLACARLEQAEAARGGDFVLVPRDEYERLVRALHQSVDAKLGKFLDACPLATPAAESGQGEYDGPVKEVLDDEGRFIRYEIAPAQAVQGAVDWKAQYSERSAVIHRWHEKAVALGYDGVEELLAFALPCIVNSGGDERPTPPALTSEEAAAVERLEHEIEQGYNQFASLGYEPSQLFKDQETLCALLRRSYPK
jgi:hypothetical protein